jgi:hypothetical protein
MERKPFTVVIGGKHCDKHPDYSGCTNYADGSNCPLYRAIKEQYPDFPLLHVSSWGRLETGGSEVDCAWQCDFAYNPCDEGWGDAVADRIADGELESYTVTIRPAWSYAQAEAMTVTL